MIKIENYKTISYSNKGRKVDGTLIKESYGVPVCPYCYDGIIVRDNNKPDVFFCNRCFREVKIFKPESSRKESFEIYIVAKRFLPNNQG